MDYTWLYIRCIYIRRGGHFSNGINEPEKYLSRILCMYNTSTIQ